MAKKKKTYGGLTHEDRMFCLNILAGYDQTEAYRKVHRKASKETAKVNACKKLTKTNLKKFLDERRAILCVKAEKKSEDVIRELEKIGFSNISNYLSFDGSNVKLKDSDKIESELLAVIESIRSSDTKEGTNISFTLHDKVKALIALGDYHKLFSKDVDGNKEFHVHVHNLIG